MRIRLARCGERAPHVVHRATCTQGGRESSAPSARVIARSSHAMPHGDIALRKRDQPRSSSMEITPTSKPSIATATASPFGDQRTFHRSAAGVGRTPPAVRRLAGACGGIAADRHASKSGSGGADGELKSQTSRSGSEPFARERESHVESPSSTIVAVRPEVVDMNVRNSGSRCDSRSSFMGYVVASAPGFASSSFERSSIVACASSSHDPRDELVRREALAARTKIRAPR